MADICKETQCTRCQHQTVCMYKETFLKAAEAVDRAVMYTEIIEVDGQKDTTVKAQKVTSLPFLQPIELQCKYYTPADWTWTGVVNRNG